MLKRTLSDSGSEDGELPAAGKREKLSDSQPNVKQESDSESDSGGRSRKVGRKRQARSSSSDSDSNYDVAQRLKELVAQGVISGEDSRRLLTMSELERETEIVRIRDQLEQKAHQMEIRARLDKEAREKERGKRTGRTVAPPPERDESDESRSSSPAPASASPVMKQSDRRRALESRKADEKDAKFNALLRKRNEKKKREQQKASTDIDVPPGGVGEETSSAPAAQQHGTRLLRANEVFSDDDSDVSSGSSDVDEPADRRRQTPSSTGSSIAKRFSGFTSASAEDELAMGETPEEARRLDAEAGLLELNRMRLRRGHCENWVHSPFFDALAVGCVVRIGIGNDPANKGQSLYRVGEVTRVVQSPKVYTLGRTHTNKAFVLNSSPGRPLRLEFLSNQPITEEEYTRFRKFVFDHGVEPPFPTLRRVEKKVKELREAEARPTTEEDVIYILEQKKKIKPLKVNFSLRKAELVKEKEAAEAMHNVTHVAELEKEIEELRQSVEEQERRAKLGSTLDIKEINARNRQRTLASAEDALRRDWEEQQKRGGSAAADPFTRRQLRPTMITSIKDEEQMKKLHAQLDQQYNVVNYLEAERDLKHPPRAAATQGASGASGTSGTSQSEDVKAVIPKPRRPVDETDLCALHGLVDIELPAELLTTVVSSAPSSLTSRATASSSAASTAPPRAPLVASRATLSLQEYKKKHGLI